MRTEKVIENAKEMSSIHFGMGMTKMTKIPTTASANTMSPRFSAFEIQGPISKELPTLASSGAGVEVASAIP